MVRGALYSSFVAYTTRVHKRGASAYVPPFIPAARRMSRVQSMLRAGAHCTFQAKMVHKVVLSFFVVVFSSGECNSL